MIKIVEANIDHLEDLTPLFDQYRIFYKQDSNQKAARKFLKERINNKEAVIFLASVDNQPIGFTQLYTSFSSVSLQPVFILNDLYVSKDARGKGIGEALLNRAKELCREKKYKGLALETGVENPAQQLYEKLGWKKDTDCFHYFWTSK
ncbi:N-acetyltransferase family protein [Maribacter sp. 2308TA10-17]|uniref:GNAT family N-acetyltransferase n=1 Tax=Maribacter sp. 2308TA10-17 TaxID=3386276 RepID=UPI0039BC4FC5